MKVLLVEDDSATVKLVELILKSEGYHCDVVFLGREGLDITSVYKYDAIIIDIVLPDLDGLELLKRIRDSGVKTPILILSGLNDPLTKVNGFGNGADDYLTKPFNRSELIARIQAMVRRSKGYASPVIPLHNNAVINTEKRIVEAHGSIVPLTSKEYTILEFLAVSRGKVISKEMFLNAIYGGIDEPETKIIDVFICKLRRKLAEAVGDNAGDIIETVWGRGYMIRSFQSNTSNAENNSNDEDDSNSNSNSISSSEYNQESKYSSGGYKEEKNKMHFTSKS